MHLWMRSWVFDMEIICVVNSLYLSVWQPGKQKKKFSSFFKSLVIELDKDLYGPDNHLVEVSTNKISAWRNKHAPSDHEQIKWVNYQMRFRINA